MGNDTEGEKVLRDARHAARQLAGELRIMAWRMRGIRDAIKLNGRYCRRDWETDLAELQGYTQTIERLCSDHAEDIVTVYRKVIAPLEKLAEAVRENDY